MDEFELTRRVYEEPPQGAAVRERARGRLDEAIRRERRARAGVDQRRRRVRFILTAASAAAIIVITIVVAAIAPFGASSAAAVELRRLGAIASEASQLEARPGEFVLMRSKELRPEAQISVVTGEGFTVVSGLDVKTWLASDGTGYRRTEVLSSGFASPADEAAWEAAGRPKIPEVGDVRIEHYGKDEPITIDLSSLPTDPGELADALRSSPEIAEGADAADVFNLIGELLAHGDASPELRSALFEVAARLESVQLIGESADPLGRQGVALAVDGGDRRVELVFDPGTSHLLAIETYPVVNGVIGEIESWRAFKPATIVEDAPER